MDFRQTQKSDIEEIMNIIKFAQNYLKEQGIDQWQNGYPNVETINEDIKKGYSYVLLKENVITGTVALSFDGEKTYNEIYKGKWLSNNKYAVIHRIAVHENYKGLGIAKEILRNVDTICKEKGITSVKVDTHEDNIFMQKLLAKNGFKLCGVICLEDGNERLAYEKLVL